ncbi:hypothetical protein N7539_008461 [Penicillium diatomitis]|uniref:Uncharacterized protein n=1 Tax=Penicillium diatomitis TaxID=2819901 RepID=A0A9W9WTS8_9EURO|nr:uncharacterized protein N7539_008461 [Penicillium diatomitis]KAJ5475395.1 hypothetical protein N7539_008461 [Penicillium diatomitis]
MEVVRARLFSHTKWATLRVQLRNLRDLVKIRPFSRDLVRTTPITLLLTPPSPSPARSTTGMSSPLRPGVRVWAGEPPSRRGGREMRIPGRVANWRVRPSRRKGYDENPKTTNVRAWQTPSPRPGISMRPVVLSLRPQDMRPLGRPPAAVGTQRLPTGEFDCPSPPRRLRGLGVAQRPRVGRDPLGLAAHPLIAHPEASRGPDGLRLMPVPSPPPRRPPTHPTPPAPSTGRLPGHLSLTHPRRAGRDRRPRGLQHRYDWLGGPPADVRLGIRWGTPGGNASPESP